MFQIEFFGGPACGRVMTLEGGMWNFPAFVPVQSTPDGAYWPVQPNPAYRGLSQPFAYEWYWGIDEDDDDDGGEGPDPDPVVELWEFHEPSDEVLRFLESLGY
ncbi:MAG: hypothetical protein AAGA99_00425 [Actinomycetota bacterium]